MKHLAGVLSIFDLLRDTHYSFENYQNIAFIINNERLHALYCTLIRHAETRSIVSIPARTPHAFSSFCVFAVFELVRKSLFVFIFSQLVVSTVRPSAHLPRETISITLPRKRKDQDKPPK